MTEVQTEGRSEIVKSIITGARSLSITAVDKTVAETTASLRERAMAVFNGGCGGGSGVKGGLCGY